jgi:hypothetical protein
VGAVLVAVHVVVAGWAAVGLVEVVVAAPPWPRLSNPELPRGVLLVHWPLMLVASAAFIGGYAQRWRHTPVAMAVTYTGLAVMCAVETVGFLTDPNRFAAMAVEYTAYATILAVLFGTPVRTRFVRKTRRSIWRVP